MKYLIIILSFIFLQSCDPYGFPIWGLDGEPVNDSITTLPIIDTCNSYQELVNTKFSTWAINLDGLISTGYEFYYKHNGGQFVPIDIDSFLNQYGQSTTYYSGINICGIVTGLDNPSYVISSHLYTFDGFGNIFEIYLRPYDLDMQGALTFDQFFDIIVNHSNFHRLGFWNTAFTQDQYLTIIDYRIDNCIDGSDNTIDLRFIPGIVDNERLDQLHLAHFTILQ
jgi:hypothetical protein